MTVRQLWVQGSEYNAVDDRLAVAALLPAGARGEYGTTVGVRSPADLVPTMRTNTQIGVTRGVAAVELGGSVYLVGSDAEELLDIAPSDPTNARIDRVVLAAYDAEAGGSDQPPAVQVLAGQAAASPVAPVLADGQLQLADVTVPAGSGVPTLTDRREFLVRRKMRFNGSALPAEPSSGNSTPVAFTQMLNIPAMPWANRVTVICTASFQPALGAPLTISTFAVAQLRFNEVNQTPYRVHGFYGANTYTLLHVAERAAGEASTTRGVFFKAGQNPGGPLHNMRVIGGAYIPVIYALVEPLDD